ncbi:outer membrane protein OmpA-like peptidoglycan-associated protein [Loktanella ponticola]|uniref:Outer membrane protein OmpA-like peptidoglycan-associated protein n=1 Tax=Yoonia ponticola TaxID=1524255 RepID=A0A7W9BLX4_9RHOB|nr:OmpA family protein [Yoonia ponticola]MBB5722474.1 outer membrane protein OmpA-like peptidoglycan-associated protein [Yoonia ponticola]
MKIYLSALAALAFLAACDQTSGGAFDRPLGSELDNSDFGNATMTNHMAQTGQNGLTINLQRRFASEVESTVNFAFNSDVLDGAARATLTQQANWIKQFPEVRFKVFGHTDLVGSNAYNRQLGLRRAQAVVAYLSSQGISRSRLEALVSFGEEQPLVATQSMERRNRRTITEVSGFVDGDGMELNGKYAAVIFREYVASAVPPTTVTQTQAPTASGG